jgi:hypothetical protein
MARSESLWSQIMMGQGSTEGQGLRSREMTQLSSDHIKAQGGLSPSCALVASPGLLLCPPVTDTV